MSTERLPEGLPEELGDFRLYPPVPGTPRTGWTFSWRGEWLPGSYGSRDACVLLCGMFLTDSRGRAEEMMRTLQEVYNRKSPSVDIEVWHILSVLAVRYR